MTMPAYAESASAPLATKCLPGDMVSLDLECPSAIRVNLPTPTVALTQTLLPKSVLPYTYAYVKTGPVAFYADPADADRGVAPVRTLDAGYVWVRLTGQAIYNGQTWYRTDSGGYLPASNLSIYRPSSFQGVTVSSQPSVPFAWVLKPVKASAAPGVKPEAGATSFKRYNIVNLYEQRDVNGQIWYRVGDNRWLVQTAVGKVQLSPRPADVGPGAKWIEVNLFEQTVAAYEGERMVYATLASTGLPRWATVTGLFHIYSKVTLGPMDGQEGKPDFYSLEDVPWAMYFYEGYSLHGTYWHDNFGYQHSHGCVNLAPLDAKWFYDWTTPVVPQGSGAKMAKQDEPGTWVWVHD